MTDVVVHAPVEQTGSMVVNSDSDPFAVFVTCVVKSTPTFEPNCSAEMFVADPLYLSRRAGMFFGGSWDEVSARVESDASTSAQGSLTRSIDGDPHPEPVAASRVRRLKDDAGLTWDQLRRLFGVSRRAVHMWAGGARMNSRNEERLAYLERIVAAAGSSPGQRREALLSSPRGSGRSIFQQLVLGAGGSQDTDIEALTESTGAGKTIHGDFLLAEAIDDIEEDR